MTPLSTALRAPRTSSPTSPGWRSPRWWLALFADVRMAVSHGLGAVALGLLACVGVVVLGWVGDTATGATWPQAVRVGADLWLLVHLGSAVTVSEVVTSASPADPPSLVPGVLSLAPLGLSLLAGALAWRAGRRTAQRCRPVRASALVLVVAAVYAAAAWLVAWSVDSLAVAPSPTACAVGAAVLAGLGGATGVLGVHGRRLLDLLPHPVAVLAARVLPATAVAVLSWLLAGAVLLTVGLLHDLATVSQVHAALAAGPVGGLMLVLGQIAYLPTAVVWAAAVLSGPGVRLGDGFLTLTGSAVVDVPAVPLLAALPAPGTFPLWAYLGLLVVVGSGALAAWHVHRHRSSREASLVDRMSDALVVAALSGVAAGVIGWLAAGSLGPWRPLGPDALVLAAVVGAEVLLGAVLFGGVMHLLAGRAIRRRGSSAPRGGR